MTVPLISDTTDPEMIRRGWDKPDGQEDFHGVKVFWEGVSNDYGNSISDIEKIRDILLLSTEKSRFKDRPMPVTYHAECAKDAGGNYIPIKDREFYCVSTQIAKAIEINPEAAHVIRHVSDYRTIETAVDWRAKGVNIHLESSPQYAVLIDDSLFIGSDGLAALQCNCVFWPRPKDEVSRKCNADLMLSGYDWVHYALDYALHLDDPTQASGVKINSRGIAVGGLNFAPEAAVSVVIDYCISRGRPEVLNGLLCTNAARLYGIRLAGPKHRWMRSDWKVPEYTYGGNGAKSACFLAGHTMRWKRFHT
jgi:dihydroorotase